MIVFGFILSFIGFLLCLTFIGAVLGVPLIFIGSLMVLFGFLGRRKTVIQNVVTVHNVSSAPERAPSSAPEPPGSAQP